MSDGVLAKSSERLAEQVAAYAGPRAVQCKTRMNEANIEVQSWPVHSQYSAQKEAAKLVDEIDLNATDVVYCYGVGLGYVYDALTKWLQGDVGRFLVFLEDEESVLQALLETERGRTLWCDPQVHVTFIGKQEAEREITLQSLAQYFVGTRLKVTALPSYAQRKDRLWQQIQMILMHKSTLINFASQEFLRCGATFFRNFYRNVWALQDSYNAAGLFGKFKGIPAIIAG
ncbi:MAG: hypothetical protein KDK78_01550, partial [Chlamydiia bacterium]|nr:hypothetical protein [Chlamydiia bacterium]